MGELDALTKKKVREIAVGKDVLKLELPGIFDVNSELTLVNPEVIGFFFDESPPQETGRKKRKQRSVHAAVQRLRDVLFDGTLLTDGQRMYALLGVENQTGIDVSMPLRVALMDVLAYVAQLEEISKRNREQEQVRRAKQEKGDRGNGDIEDKTGKEDQGEGGENDDESSDIRPMTWNEMVSGMRAEDMLKPIVTIVVHWSTEPWTGPRRLQDLIAAPEALRPYMVNNELLLLEPTKLSDEEIASCDSDLELIFKAIKNAKYKSLESIVNSDERYKSMDPTSARIITKVCGAELPLPENLKKGDRVNMVQRVLENRDNVLKEGLEKGLKQGLKQGLNGLLASLETLGAVPHGTAQRAQENDLLQTDSVANLLLEQISAKDRQISAKDRQISAKDRQISAKDRQISAQGEQISAQGEQISAQGQQISAKDQQLQRGAKRLVERGWAVSEIADFYGTTEDDVRGYLETGQPTTEA